MKNLVWKQRGKTHRGFVLGVVVRKVGNKETTFLVMHMADDTVREVPIGIFGTE
jgi:hypothetical protein